MTTGVKIAPATIPKRRRRPVRVGVGRPSSSRGSERASAAVEIMAAQSRSWPHLQQQLEIMNDVVGWSTEGRQPAEFSLPVDQIEGRRMIHCVSERRIPGNHLLGDDAVGFLNGLELAGGACGAEEARVEGGQVLAQALWTVALGIDRHVDQLDVARRATQLLVDFGQAGKRDRADLVTKGVAELQDDHFAEMVA